MDCAACAIEGRSVPAEPGYPACLMCHQRASLRGIGAHGLPWYVRIFGRCRITDTGCWEYMAARDAAGYAGPVLVKGRLARAHRFVLESITPCPKGHESDHLCHNRPCCRPDHLRWLTHRENCRHRRKPLLSPEERRVKHNAYHRAYRARNLDRCRAIRRASDQRRRNPI